MREQEGRSHSSLDGLQKVVEHDAGSSEAEMGRALSAVRELEELQQGKLSEVEHLQETYNTQNSLVDEASKSMEEADRKVAAMRKLIAEMEQELSNKQKEAQNSRAFASSDRSATQARLKDEIEQIDKKMAGLHEKAKQLQGSGDGATPPVDPAEKDKKMGLLKQEAKKCKDRKAELVAEIQKCSEDPATLEEAAAKAERQAVQLQEQLTTLRSSELVELERAHYSSRESWQLETTQLQDIRWRRDSGERELSDLKRQIEERWRTWQPLWSARLKRWHERANALGDAQASGSQFGGAVQKSWDLLKEEQDARHAVQRAIYNAQQSLVELAHQMETIAEIQF